MIRITGGGTWRWLGTLERWDEGVLLSCANLLLRSNVCRE